MHGGATFPAIAWRAQRRDSRPTALHACADDVDGSVHGRHNRAVLGLAPFQRLSLQGGFLLVEAQLTAAPLLDPLERAATAQTVIRGTRFHLLLRADLVEQELSISLYHEVLEAATVAAAAAPASGLNSTKVISSTRHGRRTAAWVW